MSSIFGGSKSKSVQQSTSQSIQESGNKAYDWAQNAYTPVVNTGNNANSAIAALLGLGGDTGAAGKAYGDYLGSTGYNTTINAGQRAITGNNAAKGLLGSGSTLKALTRFGQDTNQQYFKDYLAQLLGLTNQGLQAGGLVTGTGNYSNGMSNSQSTGNSTSSSSEGIAKTLGAAASTAAMFSDRRLKTDITPVGNNNGLTVYEYRYLWDDPETVRRGYMADEVRDYNPDAIGPKMGEFDTVLYDQLPAIGEK